MTVRGPPVTSKGPRSHSLTSSPVNEAGNPGDGPRVFVNLAALSRGCRLLRGLRVPLSFWTCLDPGGADPAPPRTRLGSSVGGERGLGWLNPAATSPPSGKPSQSPGPGGGAQEETPRGQASLPFFPGVPGSQGLPRALRPRGGELRKISPLAGDQLPAPPRLCRGRAGRLPSSSAQTRAVRGAHSPPLRERATLPPTPPRPAPPRSPPRPTNLAKEAEPPLARPRRALRGRGARLCAQPRPAGSAA